MSQHDRVRGLFQVFDESLMLGALQPTLPAHSGHSFGIHPLCICLAIPRDSSPNKSGQLLPVFGGGDEPTHVPTFRSTSTSISTSTSTSTS